MKKYFPCFVCRGKGGEKEVVTDEGDGPYYECSYCEGEGLIEIGGKRHKEIAAEAIAMKIISFRKDVKDEWSYQELQELGNKALSLI